MFNASRRFIAVAMFGMLAVGCSSSGKQAPEARKATESMSAINQDLTRAQGQIDTVVASIDKMQAGGDLKAPYAEYSAAVKEIKDAGDRLAERREDMSEHRQEYIEKWQKELESIDTPEVRAALADRKAKVSANFDRLSSSAARARESYTPFLKNLQEIDRALALDLNPNGVAALRPAMNNAKSQGATLKTRLASFQSELNEIIGQMSTAK